MRKITLLSLLGAGLIYTGCGGGELNSDSSSCEKPDVIGIQQDAAVDTYDTGVDTKKEVKADIAHDSGKDIFGLETKVSTDAVGDTEEETSADVYQITLCPDLDKDGFFGTIVGGECYAPSGKDGDCKDNNKLIYPGALEICDGLDNNCNGTTDEDITNQSYYTGAAGTLGVGTCKSGIKSCVSGKWKITTSEVIPAVKEFCDGKDNNCNGFIDEGLTNKIYYKDADGDENGDLDHSIITCSDPVGYVTNHDDCNDNDKLIYLDANETCNGKDDDCDGETDNGAVLKNYFFDGDSDGYGDKKGKAIESCVALPPGYVTNNTDCDDTNAAVNPAAKESCNAIDDNCDTIADNGLEQVVKCGYNNNGTKTADCINGTISDKTICIDPDQCKLGTTTPCEIDGVTYANLPGLKCELDATTNTYKFIPTESEDTGKFPDGKDNNCDGQVDESYFVLVPAGTYTAGCDYPSECDYAGNPVHDVETLGVYISKFETTNKQYQKCVDAGKCSVPKTNDGENYPLLDITLTQAEEYCKFTEGRLPTADEWEVAAKGGVTENVYPWDTLAPSCNLTNYWYCVGNALEVGSYSSDKSTFGTDDKSAIYDMGGNVSEWTSTLQGTSAIVKGGNWKSEPKYVAVYNEQSKALDEIDNTIGFRCVRDKK